MTWSVNQFDFNFAYSKDFPVCTFFEFELSFGTRTIDNGGSSLLRELNMATNEICMEVSLKDILELNCILLEYE